MRRQSDRGQRHFGVREVRQSLTGDSPGPPCVAGFVLTVCAGSPSRCRVLFPFPCLSRGTVARRGCGRPCAHATMARMVNKKNGRTCGEIGVTVQLSGHPERRKPSGVDLAHGEDARIQRAAGPARQYRGVNSRSAEMAGKELQVIMQTGWGGRNAPPSRVEEPAQGGGLEGKRSARPKHPLLPI